jgi:hypothetical protein
VSFGGLQSKGAVGFCILRVAVDCFTLLLGCGVLHCLGAVGCCTVWGTEVFHSCGLWGFLLSERPVVCCNFWELWGVALSGGLWVVAFSCGL